MDLRRAFSGYRFYIAVALALSILLRTLFDIVGFSDSLTFVYLQQFPFGLSDYTPFAVIFCVLPFADSFCEDYNTSYAHNITVRTGSKRYSLNRFISNALVGGITQGLIVTVVLLVCFCCADLPDTQESVSFMQGTIWYDLNLLLRFHSILFILLRVLLAFLFGSLWASVGLCISAFSTNRYITLVAPFVIYQMLWRLIPDPRFSPLETLVGNSVPSLLLLILNQIILILICGIITVKQIQKRILL